MRSERVMRGSRGDDGAVAIVVAIMSVFLTGMLAFASDLGNAYSTQRRLSTAADGAALAAAQQLADLNAGCGGGVSGATSSAALIVANDYSTNRNAPGSNLQSGTHGFSLACPASSSGGLVTVGNEQQVDYAFGNLFGVSSSRPTGSATAQYGPAKTVTGLRPFGVCQKSAEVAALLASGAAFPLDNDASFALRPTVRITIDNLRNGDCGTAGGNWGVLDFNGGSNPTSETAKWILNGYDQELDLSGATIAGNPGAPKPGALDSEMTATVGKTITLPIFDSVTGNGNGAAFHVTGFVSAQLCGWKFGNKSSGSACSTILPVGGASAPDFLELRFRQSFTVGEFANCGASCPVTGVRTIRLVPTP
jgi:Flp pilus assembly protein TadG